MTLKLSNPTYTTWLYTASRSLSLLLVTSLILIKFNKEEIMLWYLFSTIISLSHQFDLGFSSTIIRFTSYNRASQKKGIELQQNYSSFSTIYFLLSLLVFLALIVLYFISISTLSLDIDNDSLKIAYGSILFTTPVVFYLKKNDSFLKGLDKVNLYNNWNSTMSLFNSIVIITLLVIGTKFYLIVVFNQFLVLINSLKNFLLLKKEMSFRINFFEFEWNKKKILEIWSPTWRTALISASSTGSYNLINVLTPRLFGVDVSSSYLFSIKILQLVAELSNAPFYSRLPGFIANYKKGFSLKDKKEIIKNAFKCLDILIVATSILILFSEPILIKIKSNTDLLPLNILKLFLFYMFFERIAGMLSQIIMFTNKIDYYLGYIASSLGFIILILIFQSLGLKIIPLSGLLCSLFLAAYLFTFTKNILSFDKRELTLLSLRITILILIYIIF